MKGKISDALDRAIRDGTAHSLLRSRRPAARDDPPAPDIDDTVTRGSALAIEPPGLTDPTLNLTIQEIPVDKTTALQFLRAQLTEERTDQAIQFIGDEAKLVLPDIPVEIAERLLDWLMPERVLAAIEHVLD